jgi:hypothetical protein
MMTSVSPSQTGVAGALFQVCLQVGVAYPCPSSQFVELTLVTHISFLPPLPLMDLSPTCHLAVILAQTGVALALPTQSGLLTYRPGSVKNWTNVEASFWFQFGWCTICALLSAIFFKEGDMTGQLGHVRAEAAKASKNSQSGDERSDVEIKDVSLMEGVELELGSGLGLL